MEWYQMLIRPDFAPPAELFGPVWSVLYIVIAISFGYVFVQIIRKRLPVSVGIPFALNLVFNLSFTPITFCLQNLFMGSVIILATLGTIVWMMVWVWPYSRVVAYAQVPYLLWVSFATVLQLTITYLNLTDI